MDIKLRTVQPSDIAECGRILYLSFKGIADQHGYRPELPNLEYALRTAASCVYHHSTEGHVAELDGQMVGSIFIDKRDKIFGIGPVSVDTNIQGKGIGRKMMEEVINNGRDGLGIRLCQDSFNARSISLYAALGLDVREPLAFLEGNIRGEIPSDVKIRPLKKKDLIPCADLCQKVHGIIRTNELKDSLKSGAGFVLIRDGQITAYTSGVAYWGHGVAEDENEMKLLLMGVQQALGTELSFVVPTRQTGLFRWCLDQGMDMIKPMTLMGMGFYQEPRGCFFTSATY